jgi:putative phosphoribosyl transferase
VQAVKQTDVAISVGDSVQLKGVLSEPHNAKSTVIFSHGSGSSRLSPRNRQVSDVLNQSGIATLLFDLLTDAEAVIDDKTREYRFDIGLLTGRLISATKRILESSGSNRAVGYFGASTGAAAALAAAANLQGKVGAIVSRGGRPDLAGSDSLKKVTSATLFLVGGNDPETITLNQKALSQMKGASAKRLVIVPGAGHLFEEKGMLEEAAMHSASWFETHLR